MKKVEPFQVFTAKWSLRAVQFVALAPAAFSVSCAALPGEEEEVRQVEELAVSADPVSLCNQDPRVWMGMVPLNVCAGARVFFDEDFSGNGRTCGTCHPAENNFTIDTPFIAQLPTNDSLFVSNDPNFDLSLLETDQLNVGMIRENIDGFEDLEFKFVARSVPHTLSMKASIARDPGDGTSAAVVERTGWSGDGAPGDGSLRSFLDGAIKQHYPKDNARTPGTSFRFATEAEKDQTLAFQLALGRTSDINLANVTLTDARATLGKQDFLDPLRGRCNECHSNAGANFASTGLNRNFDTGVLKAPVFFVEQPDGSFLFDGGFGGQGEDEPNFTTVTNQPDAFGDGTFSTPPLIEAADTAPLFHTNGFGNIETGVSFYATNLFLQSPAAAELDARFGSPVDISGEAVPNIGRFLRVLNTSFNLAIAMQRLKASHTLNVSYWAYRDDVQKGLLKLASAELNDALEVLTSTPTGPTDLHPAQQKQIKDAITLLNAALAATNPAVRRDKTAQALTKATQAKNALGSGLNFQLGTGNLMF